MAHLTKQKITRINTKVGGIYVSLNLPYCQIQNYGNRNVLKNAKSTHSACIGAHFRVFSGWPDGDSSFDHCGRVYSYFFFINYLITRVSNYKMLLTLKSYFLRFNQWVLPWIDWIE